VSYPSSHPNSPSQCAFDQHWSDTTVVISCAGVIDLLTAPDFEQQIASALDKQPSAVIVDLSAVEFLASCGMGVLVATRDQLAPDVGFVVVADGPVTRRPMELVGLTRVFTIHPTLDAALESIED
jgi:anti-sigma B factor antagonist